MASRWSTRLLARSGAIALAAALVPPVANAWASVPTASSAFPVAGAGASVQTSPSAFRPPPPATVTSTSPGATGTGFHATIEHLLVHTGPNRATACSIIGELFVPDLATSSATAPAILTTNGFGGSYTDQVSLAELGARHGYVVLTYSGLGFGGSGCNIELDSKVWDGEAASQLVSYLATLPTVTKDSPGDPRVGMVGGSYGGEVQFAAAAVDPRIDALIPIITWNDLAYSLAPNNSSSSLNWSTIGPGVLKWQWSSLFFGDGLSAPFQNPTATPFPPSTCPGFDPAVCSAYLDSVAYGYPTPSVVSLLQNDSVFSYYHQVKVPTMLMQGEADSLFNIDEAVANYHLLRSIGDPVKLVLQSWGHSNLTPAPGELSYTSLSKGYETVLVFDWFAKYLKHQTVSTGPQVEYFRPWVHYTTPSAEPAYGTATSWPVGSSLPLYLSGGGTLVRHQDDVIAGSQTFAAPPAGEPGSYSETSGVQDTSPFISIPPSDPPGTTATFTTPPLGSAIDSVGVPVLHVAISGATASSADPATEAVVFAKIYDVAPDGRQTLVNRLVAPTRLSGSGSGSGSAGLVTLTLPGVVHRYAQGDRIEVVLAATDQAYLGARVPDALTVTVSPSAPGFLSLPFVAPSAETSGGPRASGS